MASRRNSLIAQLRQLAPTVIGGGVLLHQLIADRVGLHLTDLKVLQLLRAQALSAGQIASHSGLTSGAVTRLIDRLERGGYVRRVDDPEDRRRVLVEAVPSALAKLEPYYRGLASAWDEVLQRYDERDLRVILDLFSRMQALTNRQIAEAKASDDAMPRPSGR